MGYINIDMARKATCPDCGKKTEWIATVTDGYGNESIERFQALCDGCQADRAIASAFEGTDY
jgi:uncharacterized protein CbrC (UPF0167 family)